MLSPSTDFTGNINYLISNTPTPEFHYFSNPSISLFSPLPFPHHHLIFLTLSFILTASPHLTACFCLHSSDSLLHPYSIFASYSFLLCASGGKEVTAQIVLVYLYMDFRRSQQPDICTASMLSITIFKINLDTSLYSSAVCSFSVGLSKFCWISAFLCRTLLVNLKMFEKWSSEKSKIASEMLEY